MNGLHLPIEAQTGRRLIIKIVTPIGNKNTMIEFPAAYVINDPVSCRNMIEALHSVGCVEYPDAVRHAHAIASEREKRAARKVAILRRVVEMRKSGQFPIPEPKAKS